jgi:hypothetical protein
MTQQCQTLRISEFDRAVKGTVIETELFSAFSIFFASACENIYSFCASTRHLFTTSLLVPISYTAGLTPQIHVIRVVATVKKLEPGNSLSVFVGVKRALFTVHALLPTIIPDTPTVWSFSANIHLKIEAKLPFQLQRLQLCCHP